MAQPPSALRSRAQPFEAGSQESWARDFALIGAVSALCAPAFVIMDPGFSIAASLAGGLLGAGLGWFSPPTLRALRKRVPLTVLTATAPLIGMVWGALAGAVGGVFVGGEFGGDGSGVLLGILMGGLAGMVQLGWLWLPYTVQAVRGGHRWPMVLGACLLAPGLGWAAVALFLLMTPILALSPFLLPVMVLAALQVERGVRKARLEQASGRAAIAESMPEVGWRADLAAVRAQAGVVER